MSWAVSSMSSSGRRLVRTTATLTTPSPSMMIKLTTRSSQLSWPMGRSMLPICSPTMSVTVSVWVCPVSGLTMVMFGTCS